MRHPFTNCSYRPIPHRSQHEPSTFESLYIFFEWLLLLLPLPLLSLTMNRKRKKRCSEKSAAAAANGNKRQCTADSSEDNRLLSLYLLYNDCDDVKTRTYIGCVEDVFARLLQHNGITDGAPRQTRKAQGHWKLLCILLVPPSVRKRVSTKEIKSCWRSKSRGVERRIKQGVELSRKYDLYCFLSESLLKEEEWNVVDLMKQYSSQNSKRKLVLSIMNKQCQS